MIENRRRFNKQEYSERAKKTRQAMSEKGVELLIVTDPSNINWLTGYDAWSFYVHQCVVIGSDNTLFWFGRIIDAAGAAMTTDLSAENIIEYPDNYVQSEQEHPMEYLAEILTEKSLSHCKIGLEKDNYYFSARAAESLYRGLPNAEFVDVHGLVNWQRAVKSSQELVYMQRAGQVVEKIYERVMAVAQPGMRKNELVAEILHAGTLGTAEHFGDYPAIVPLIGVGEESAACHLTWDGGTIPANSGICMELTGVHARYHSPCSRTLFFGKPTQEYLDMEKMILESINIPVASGETEYTRFGMKDMLEKKSVDVLMPDLQRIGGLSEFRKSAALASAYHVPISTHIFTEQSLSIAGSAANCISVEHVDWFSPLYNESIQIGDGYAMMPEGAGLGFSFNQDFIRDHLVKN